MKGVMEPGAVVEPGRQATDALVEETGEVVEEDAVVGVAPGAGEPVGAEKGETVVEKIDREGRFEVIGEKERGIWGVASLSNKLDRSLSFQTSDFGRDVCPSSESAS